MENARPKYPILLVHGLGLRDDHRLLKYWGKLPQFLEERGDLAQCLFFRLDDDAIPFPYDDEFRFIRKGHVDRNAYGGRIPGHELTGYKGLPRGLPGGFPGVRYDLSHGGLPYITT